MYVVTYVEKNENLVFESKKQWILKYFVFLNLQKRLQIR